MATKMFEYEQRVIILSNNKHGYIKVEKSNQSCVVIDNKYLDENYPDEIWVDNSDLSPE